jgi:hypothetical protein
MADKTLNQKQFQLLCKEQMNPLEQAMEEIDKLKTENIKLKSLLAKHSIGVEKIAKSDEAILCENQIKKLKEQALNRELTLEEVKKMDILVKNLNITKNKDKIINAKSRKFKDEEISDAQLIEVLSDGKS